MSIRLAIGCGNHVYSEGLKRLLEDDREIEVIGTFDGRTDFLASFTEILKLNPDVILADFTDDINELFTLSGELLSADRLKILLIGNRMIRFLADGQLKSLVSKGLVGIIPPSADSVLLKRALAAIIKGELWLDRATLLKLFAVMKHQGKNSTLAKREKEIVFYVCQGYRNKEIAQKLHISEQTVKSHCNRIYRKLGVSDRLQLALYTFKSWPDGAKDNEAIF